MRKIFAALDDVLIERMFQPASEAIANQMGMTRATAACCCTDAASFAWIISRAPAVSDAVIGWDATAAFLDIVLLLLGLVALISLRTLFRRAATRKQANPLRLAMQPHRAVVLLMLAARLAQLHAAGLADAADLAMLICAASALYLGACMERPPIRYRPRMHATMSEVETDAV